MPGFKNKAIEKKDKNYAKLNGRAKFDAGGLFRGSGGGRNSKNTSLNSRSGSFKR